MAAFKIINGKVVRPSETFSSAATAVKAEINPGARILCIGEAPGVDEQQSGRPFSGAAGRELTRQLEMAGLQRSDCHYANVIPYRPADNNFYNFCCKKDDLPADYNLPPVGRETGEGVWYLSPDFVECLANLAKLIRKLEPNLIVTLGNKALWAFTGEYGIKKLRGHLRMGQLLTTDLEWKFLPTIHPAAVLRQWSDRLIVVADLAKARQNSKSPKLEVTNTEISVPETVEELEEYADRFLFPADIISCDIETSPKREQITIVGFASSPYKSIVIPIVDHDRYGFNYWKPEDEVRVWKVIARLLSECRIVMQNGMYDTQWFIRQFGIVPRFYEHDTMLLHHALQPEAQKSLNFLASLYTNRTAWKADRRGPTLKRED